jgi:hemoglobin/transferrin/lactoferrin receptor protein
MIKNLCKIALLFSIVTHSQSIDSTQTKKIEEVKINSKAKINRQQIPSQVDVISKKTIEFQNFQNTADMLSNSGKLFVQKSQQGGGSPVIRGFESSRVLLLVDGIRMNNLIFRSGHLQNVITVDENFLDNTIINYGPSSTLYGSDALGGSINMLTKSAEVGKNFGGNIYARYSSANEEKSGAFDLNYGGKNWGALTIFSYNDFGDLRMGKKRNHNGDFFGERTFYQESYTDPTTGNNVDVTTENKDKYIQVGSAYKQWNFLQKFVYETENKYRHSINFQYSNTTDVPRYDRLTEKSNANMRFGEWYYGPQKRILGVYSLEKENIFGKTNAKIDLSYQDVEESRHDRRFGNVNLRNREEAVKMYGANAHFNTKWDKSDLFFGLENYYETLNSTAFVKNINTGAVDKLDTRYPDGDNNMLRNEIYASFNTNNEKTNFTFGARLGYAQLNSSIVDNSFFNFPFTEIKQNNLTYSATAGIAYNTSENVVLKTNISSGFRVPNIDDLAKVFETSNTTIVVPNNNLEPEKTLTTDLGVLFKTKNNEHTIEGTYYYTKVQDAIVTDDFTFNGQTQLDVDGDGTFANVVANQNLGEAFITGFSTAVKSTLAKGLLFTGSFNYTLGRVKEETGDRRPLDHIAPYYGRVGLSYRNSYLIADAYMLYNGKKRLRDYSSSGEDNLQYAPATGMPAWETYNLKLSSSDKFIKATTLYFGVENLLDTQYRVFASGINAAGRNVYLGLKYTL